MKWPIKKTQGKFSSKLLIFRKGIQQEIIFKYDTIKQDINYHNKISGWYLAFLKKKYKNKMWPCISYGISGVKTQILMLFATS